MPTSILFNTRFYNSGWSLTFYGLELMISGLYLPNAGIAGICHHAQFYAYFPKAFTSLNNADWHIS